MDYTAVVIAQTSFGLNQTNSVYGKVLQQAGIVRLAWRVLARMGFQETTNSMSRAHIFLPQAGTKVD